MALRNLKTETRVGLFIIIALALFFYMTFYLGIFRFDRPNYNPYIVYFTDVSGLLKKADVKIAGVKIGWIDRIELTRDDSYVKTHILVKKGYKLYQNAYAIVRQESLLGAKYLEIVTGDALLPEIEPGQALQKPGRSPASVDEILHKVSGIATHFETISDSFQETFGTIEGKETLKTIMENFKETAKSFAAFSDVLDRTLSKNENTIDTIINDVSNAVYEIKTTVPSLKNNLERIANVFDRDFGRVADEFERAADSARDSFSSINAVAHKIDHGKGVLSTLINDEDTADDLKYTVEGIKDYMARLERLEVVFDSHSEFMFRPAEHFLKENNKGYFDIRIHPNDDYFYIIQFVNSIKGKIKRIRYDRQWFDEGNNPLLPSELIAEGVFIPELIGKVREEIREQDAVQIGVQFGKIFKHIALRGGLIEGFAGFGVDVDIPFPTDKFRWVTTFEAFDFRGRNRFGANLETEDLEQKHRFGGDSRPHLKWINRLFVLKNIYFVFGADDFVSRQNANAFVGGGIRFCDDDIKYFASRLAINT